MKKADVVPGKIFQVKSRNSFYRPQFMIWPVGDRNRFITIHDGDVFTIESFSYKVPYCSSQFIKIKNDHGIYETFLVNVLYDTIRMV